MNILTKALLSLSRTDPLAIADCPPSVVQARASLGLVVLLSFFLAAGSAFLALQLVFGDGLWTRFWALFYGVLVATINREFVATTTHSWLRVAVRIVFAVLVGVTIALPLEMRLFKGRIEGEISQLVATRNAPTMREIQTIEQRVDGSRGQLRTLLAQQAKEVARISEEKEREGKLRGGVGKRWMELQVRLDGAQQRMDELHAEEKSLALSATDAARIAQLRAAIENERVQSTDLLSRFEALTHLTDQNPLVAVMTWMLRLLLVFLELTPLILKLCMPEDEYDALVNCRRSVTRQKLIAVSNHRMETIMRDPAAANSTDYDDSLRDLMNGTQGPP